MKIKEHNIDYYLGKFNKCYWGYSNNPRIRSKAASGGIVSTILIYLLNNNYIDGALVSKLIVENNKITSKTFIATTPKEILDCRTSIYFNIPLLSYLEEIKKFKGKLAIVGLPCDITNFKRVEKNLKRKKPIFYVGLFCGHNSQKELLYRVLKKKNIDITKINNFIFRKGLWRGRTHIEFKDSSKTSFKFQNFSVYQNLHFLSLKKCIYCSDHFSEEADITCGDIWLDSFKKRNIKHSAFVTRNQKADDIIQEMIQEGVIKAQKINPLMICRAQKRALTFHKSINARSIVGKLFGINIKKNKRDKARWNDLIAAFIILLNHKISESTKLKNILFKIPKPIITLYLYFFKILTNF